MTSLSYERFCAYFEKGFPVQDISLQELIGDFPKYIQEPFVIRQFDKTYSFEFIKNLASDDNLVQLRDISIGQIDKVLRGSREVFDLVQHPPLNHKYAVLDDFGVELLSEEPLFAPGVFVAHNLYETSPYRSVANFVLLCSTGVLTPLHFDASSSSLQLVVTGTKQFIFVSLPPDFHKSAKCFSGDLLPSLEGHLQSLQLRAGDLFHIPALCGHMVYTNSTSLCLAYEVVSLYNIEDILKGYALEHVSR